MSCENKINKSKISLTKESGPPCSPLASNVRYASLITTSEGSVSLLKGDVGGRTCPAEGGKRHKQGAGHRDLVELARLHDGSEY